MASVILIHLNGSKTVITKNNVLVLGNNQNNQGYNNTETVK